MSFEELKEKFLETLRHSDLGVTAVAREVGVNRNTAFGWARQAGIRSRGVGGNGPHPRKSEYMQLRAEGMSRREAAAHIGVNVRTARDWDRGVKRSGSSRIYPDGRRVDYNTGMTTFKNGSTLSPVEAVLHPRYLTVTQRETIADMYRAGASLRAIGRALGKPASTIKRELDARSTSGQYQPYAAHRAWVRSRPRPKTSKLISVVPLRQYVQEKLLVRWSPEQISHTLRKEFPNDESMRVSPETIYQALYVQARGGLKREVAEALRTGRTRRKPRKHPDHRRSRFVDEMVMISQRPAEVEDRAVPGHWEGDLIVGPGSASAIVTLVERTTRYVVLGHLASGHTAEEVRDVLTALIGTLPKHLRGSLTWDQGVEMAAHKQFSIATGVPVFFCDPHSPWQRGSNENTNGLLRQYFPKSTDLRPYGPEDLEHVAQELNGRPRKTLGWDTPAERLRDLLMIT